MKRGRIVDIELTNKCNTACIFCPRDRTPTQGFITPEIFEKAVRRVTELEDAPDMKFCGLGEPLMHPKVVEFVGRLTSEGMPPSVSTNALLLKQKMGENLINAGLEQICISMSGIGETYKKIHLLDFEVVKKNIINFLKISEGRVKVKISIVVCDENRNEIDSIKAFWQGHGLNDFTLFNHINRSGTLEKNYYFSQSHDYIKEAAEIMEQNSLHGICLGPLVFNFIGWDGNYYLCSNEYAKLVPLGSVDQYSLEEMDEIKKSRMTGGLDVCDRCDLHVVNRIREQLFRIEKNEATQADLDNEIAEIKNIQQIGACLI